MKLCNPVERQTSASPKLCTLHFPGHVTTVRLVLQEGRTRRVRCCLVWRATASSAAAGASRASSARPGTASAWGPNLEEGATASSFLVSNVTGDSWEVSNETGHQTTQVSLEFDEAAALVIVFFFRPREDVSFLLFDATVHSIVESFNLLWEWEDEYWRLLLCIRSRCFNKTKTSISGRSSEFYFKRQTF